MDRLADAPPPAVVSLAAPDWTISSVGASELAAATMVLLLLYITGRFLWVYNKNAAAETSAFTAAAAVLSSSSAAAADSVPPVVPPLSRDVILSMLPVLVQVNAGSAPPPPECAVCLSPVTEAGRLMPACGHGFHEECIVAWLRLNATCPLCRAAVGMDVGPS